MRERETVKSVAGGIRSRTQTMAENDARASGLSWWQLSLIGIGSIIGAGFFLGTGLSVRQAGPSILFDYILGGVTALLVFAALAEMSVRDPEVGSFRTYARQAFGSRIGFMSGWMYWVAGVLIMSSEVTALAIFTRYWFPSVPIWLFAASYAALGLGINAAGVRNFGKAESLFAVVKMATLLIFVLFVALFVLGVIPPEAVAGGARTSLAGQSWFPHGLTGTAGALIFVLFSYGGLEVIGVMAGELRRPADAPKAGASALIALTVLYTASLALVLSLVPWQRISASESPFVTALSAFEVPYLDSVLNLILISAAFSTMAGALFAITRIMVSLANDGQAPRRLAAKNRRGVPLHALGLSAAALAIGIGLSVLLPNQVYEYLTTAAGVTQILNWVIILSSQLVLRKRLAQAERIGTTRHGRMLGYPYTSWLGIGLIACTVAGAAVQADTRIGVIISVSIITALLAGSYLLHPRAKTPSS